MRSLNDIKSWFKTGKFPTENQFSEAWDSFWHKAESISISAVDSLQKILSSKADRELVDNQVNDLRQNKEDVGVARNLVEAHNVAPDAHQELFNLKANDAEVYHRDVLDSRFASHAEDEELHFTEEEKIKLHNVGKFVTNVGVEAGQQGGLNLMVGSVLPESSAATTVSSLELPLVTDQTNGLLSPAQKSVLDHLAIGGTSLTAEGTPSAVWQLNGSSGPKLKNSGNSFELRNAEDSAYTDLTVNNLSIKGSVVQEGGSFITQAETVEVKDNMILVNKGEISGGVSKGSAGIEVDRGTEENYRMIFDESDDRFKAGKGNDLHVVALRDADAAFADQHFVKWDAATHTFKDGGNSAPASDVYDWAKQPVKPSYSAAEVGAAASNHDHSGVYQPAGSYALANHSHVQSEIADFPTALPASDVYAWAKAAVKPSYKWSEINEKPAFAMVANSGNYNDLNNKPNIPSLSGYATEAWVQGQGYLTTHQSLDEYAQDFTITVEGNLVRYKTLGANGAVLTNRVYTPQVASTTNNGVVTNGNQTFGGAKTFVSSVTSAAGFYDTSDWRLKSGIKEVELQKNKICLYEFDKGGKHSCGVIAQEIEEIYPWVVQDDELGYKTVNYNEVLVIKCAEQDQKLASLEAINSELVVRLEKLERLMNKKGLLKNDK